jgi:HlyD family secretion protein
MNRILGLRRFHLSIALLFLGGAIALLYVLFKDDAPELILTTAEVGTVRELISVSGFVEAQNAAELAFPTTGIIESISVKEGDAVKQGDILMSLKRDSLFAERQSALAALKSATADLEELVSGPREEARTVTDTEVAIAKSALEQTITEETNKVNNARRTLLSSDLVALSVSGQEQATAPIITGTYSCDAEGSYTLEVFRSSAESGFSFRLSGLESGTFPAATEQPSTFGICGLFARFDPDDNYGGSTWTVHIPNTKSASYVTNQNSYSLARTQSENAIATARQQLSLSEQEKTLSNADPRTEEITRARAAVEQAQARLASVEAQLQDRIIVAPFAGVITKVVGLPGETVSNEPALTILANDNFDMTVRIPEIDITKVALGQRAEILFDAESSAPILGSISFISPIATEIDGVAYFEATITFDTPPPWIRAGLNADVDIITTVYNDVVRLPKRFVTETDGQTAVYVISITNDTIIKTYTPVTISFTGNDGFVALEGLEAGVQVSAP